MMDPENKDNRYVDRELWSQVGQSWVEMMMDPENHSDTSSGDSGDYHREPEDEVDYENVPADISYGSIEGVGGLPGCSSREVELENKLSELRYQLARLGVENRELERNLAASDELGQSLTTELEGSQRQMVTLSTSINKGEMFFEEVKQVKEVEQQCCSLQEQVEELTKELHEKEDKLGNMDVVMNTIRGEVEEFKEREDLVNLLLMEEKKKCAHLEEALKDKNEQVAREIVAREDVEGRLEITQLEVQRLELELSFKEEEIKNLTETTSRLGSVGSSGGGLSSSLIHDVSVDDRVIEENLKNQHSPAPVFTPGKLPLQSPIRRGPSASSTPNKGRQGSIADVLKEMDTYSGFLSPFCEKNGSLVKKEVLKFVDRFGESVRKIMVDKMEPGKSGQVMAILNKEVFVAKRIIEEMVDDLPSKEELKIIKENAAELEDRLVEAKAVIENLNNVNDLKDAEFDLPEDEVAEVSTRVDAVANLLQTANSALLSVSVECSTTAPDCSLDAETDLSNWQLDLEGIQLVEWNTQLSRKLVKYTRCGKKNTLTEISTNHNSPFPTELSKSPVPGSSMLWQSLHNRLEDLLKASEVSRDLLMLAGDSMREQSINKSANMMFPKTVSCQTESVVCQTKTCQTSTTTPKSVCQSSQTDQDPPSTTHTTTTTCQVANCFCSSSQARSTSTRWKSALRAVGSLVLILLLFTFLCGLEIDHAVYSPATWYPLRLAVGDWLPTPLVIMSYQTVSTGVW